AFLLANTRRSVTQILHEVGFHNHQAFNRVFKKKFRLSPLQFRFKKAMMRGANLS
ncbi:MAG: helix-turn-helix domain-containing protein, partial [Spirochaetia bacterium]|nr:helix-turn-helix domain-containing protein [Spirochaetia bacterium]